MELGRVSRDSTGFHAMEEVLISSGGRNLNVPLVTSLALAESDCKVPAELGQEGQASSCVEE